MTNDGVIDVKEADLLVKFIKVLLLESKRCGMECDLFLSNSIATTDNGGHISIQILLWLLFAMEDKGVRMEV